MRFLGWVVLLGSTAVFFYGALNLIIWIGFGFSSYIENPQEYFYSNFLLVLTSSMVGLPFFFGLVGVAIGFELISNPRHRPD